MSAWAGGLEWGGGRFISGLAAFFQFFPVSFGAVWVPTSPGDHIPFYYSPRVGDNGGQCGGALGGSVSGSKEANKTFRSSR